jgi:hypothetical protein
MEPAGELDLPPGFTAAGAGLSGAGGRGMSTEEMEAQKAKVGDRLVIFLSGAVGGSCQEGRHGTF